jgi:hypothetical protein
LPAVMFRVIVNSGPRAAVVNFEYGLFGYWYMLPELPRIISGFTS